MSFRSFFDTVNSNVILPTSKKFQVILWYDLSGTDRAHVVAECDRAVEGLKSRVILASDVASMMDWSACAIGGLKGTLVARFSMRDSRVLGAELSAVLLAIKLAFRMGAEKVVIIIDSL